MTDERLAKALDVFLHCRESGIPRAQALTAHPELSDLLDPLFAGDHDPDHGDAPAAGDGDHGFGDYRLVRELGRGGAGVVHEAVQRSLGRRVALKILADGAAANPTQVARLRREAKALASLQHPHVVRVHDVGEHDGRHWLAMDLVDGGTLAERIAALRSAGGHHDGSLRHLLGAVAAIADALAHVHAHGVIHRDVKPSNVLLRGDGTALLSDFGLAHSTATPTVTLAGAVAGTPHYMSPEHVHGKAALGPASDVFSLGAVLYECVTLERPFDGATTAAVLQQILVRAAPDPRRVQRGLHRDLAAIVAKALEKDVARRYATAGALATDLRAFLDLRPVRARLPSPPRRAWRWVRREPARAAAAAALLAAAGLGVALWLQAPDLRAAAAARAEQDYEAALATAWTLRWSDRRDECLAAFARARALRPHGAEALAHECLGLRAFDGTAAALQRLDRDAATADDPRLIAWTRHLFERFDGGPGIPDALPVPRSPTELWFAGTVDMLPPGVDAARNRRALERISLAVRLSPVPRLPMVIQWAAAAIVADDDAALRESARTLVEHWPEQPHALYHAARAYARNEPERALELVRRAYARGMPELDARWLEFRLVGVLGRADEDLAVARAALGLPWDAARRAVLIECLLRHGEADEAREAAAAWLAAEPNSTDAGLLLASALDRSDPDRALAVCEALVARSADQVAAHHKLAHEYAERGRIADALASVRRALALDPTFEKAHVTLCELSVLAGDAAGSMAEHERWVGVRPDEPGAWLALAASRFHAGPDHLAAALDAVATADALARGQDPATLELRARIHDALGERSSAAQCRERVRRLAPR